MTKTTAQRIERIRRERGLTQTELARMIDTRPATISDIENEKRQVGRWLVPLAKALGVSTDYLLGLDDAHQRMDSSRLDALPEDRQRLIAKLVEWLAESQTPVAEDAS